MDKKQITNMEVKKNNRNRVFRYLCGRETLSNPAIAYDMKMSLPTVTQITKELIGEGLVEEAGELQSTGGRRAKALSVAWNAMQAVGLDITKNHINLAFTNLSGKILKYVRIFLPYAANDAYYEAVNEKLESFLDECGVDREKMLGIGISFPGIIDLDREMIANSHILGVESVSFASISRFFSYPCTFLNDANAGAYAEGLRLDGEGSFFYLSLSDTVGGAVFDHGKLIQGKRFRCGEVGHMTIVPGGARCYCGKQGCLDVYCAAGCLSDAAGGKLEDFFAALAQGDKKAAEVWDRYIDYLAVAVNNIYMVLDCDIILGGYVGSYAEAYMQGIWDKVSERNTFAEDDSFVRACHYKEGAAALGAARKLTEAFISQV